MNRARLTAWEWMLVLVLLLTAWFLRVWQPTAVPPGWRDDELIEMHVFSGQVLAGHPTVYFTGASGHEPLYHTLRAGVIALVGTNAVGGHLLSVACGLLTVALTYVLARRCFGRAAAGLAAALLASSFWSLMYSRFGLRHVLVLPCALALFYGLWKAASAIRPSRHARWLMVACGLALAAALYTYTVARMLPFILLAFGLYLALLRRDHFRRWWRPLLVTLLVAGVATLPLWAAIAAGRSEAARQGIGADARIAELAVPLHELRAGNPQPLWETIRTTLGMFHATGDPEWLYNLPGRPVFGPPGATLFFIGVGICLWRWRRPPHAFLLIWLLGGIGPALITLPAASLSHTLLAQPAAYIIAALPFTTGATLLAHRPPRRLRLVLPLLALGGLLLYVPTPLRDLRDYFVTWPVRGMVRFLYRADYRSAAHYLDEHPALTDVALSSTLMGPWDRVALADDLHRTDVRARLFDPRRALLWPAGSDPALLLTTFPSLDPALEGLLGAPLWEGDGLRLVAAPDDLPPLSGPTATFANGLELLGASWSDAPQPGGSATLWLAWRVAASLDLPPTPLEANPPPPGVYNGPRLAVFTHLFAADGTFVTGDDGLWVDPVTLQAGDRFLQIHPFTLPADTPPGPYRLEVGLYDPLTGDRWPTSEGQDRVVWEGWP